MLARRSPSLRYVALRACPVSVGTVNASSSLHPTRLFATFSSADVQFEVFGDEKVLPPRNPWPTPSKEAIRQRLVEKAQEVASGLTSKLNSKANPFSSGIYEVVPLNEEELQKQLAFLDDPKILPIEDDFDGKNDHYITDPLSSRLASLMDDPAFRLYYAPPQPVLALKANWKSKLLTNFENQKERQYGLSLQKILDNYREVLAMEQKLRAEAEKAIRILQEQADLDRNREKLREVIKTEENVQDEIVLDRLVKFRADDSVAAKTLDLVKSTKPLKLPALEKAVAAAEQALQALRQNSPDTDFPSRYKRHVEQLEKTQGLASAKALQSFLQNLDKLPTNEVLSVSHV